MPPPPSGPLGVEESSGKESSGKEFSSTSKKPVKKFTWKQLSELNRPENAHVAVRGKVSVLASLFSLQFFSVHVSGIRC